MKRLLISILKPNRKKNLTEAQSIELLQRLKHLFEHGFTLYESFQFLNLHFIYRDKNISKIIIESIQAGGTCYEVLKMIGYPEITYSSKICRTVWKFRSCNGRRH